MIKRYLVPCITFALGIGLVGGESHAEDLTSLSPTLAWVQNASDNSHAESSPMARNAAQSVDGHANFAVQPNQDRAELPDENDIDTAKTYNLPDLIDLAERINPTTYIAWQKAKQAALAVKMANATFYPTITGTVVGGYHRYSAPLPNILGNTVTVNDSAWGTAEILSLQWLAFDFGQRNAAFSAAKQAAVAANMLYSGSHQKLILNVAQAYYVYASASENLKFADAAVQNARLVQAAVSKRYAHGLTTSVQVAQATQAVDQAILRQVQAQGEKSNDYQILLSTVGVHVPLKIDTGNFMNRSLPKFASTPVDAAIRQALARRPDVAAAYETMMAAQTGIKAARANFMPKIFAAANVTWGSSSFSLAGLPALSQQGVGDSVLLGITVPLFDGGLRDAQLQDAESKAAVARSDFQRVQYAAVTEIVTARNGLRTALQSYHAATALVDASQITYNAALAAYNKGMGTIDAATTADTALLNARQSQIDARAAVLISAIKLAFVLGKLTSNHDAAQ